MQLLKADTLTKVVIGPVVAVGDGFTPITTLALTGGGAADEAEILKHDAAAVTDISGNTFAAITSADGYYNLTITAAQLDTEGRLTVLINDDSLCLPVRADFMVVNANVFDSLYAATGTDYLDTEVAAAASNVFTNSSFANGAITAAKIAAGAITSAKFDTDAIDSTALAASAVSEIQSGLATPTNITAGTITTVTNLTNLPTIPTNWLTAAGIAATALNGKGDWNTVTPDAAGTASGLHTTTDAAIAALNDIAATDIVSGGAITTSAGAVSNVTLVATTTTNTDMRGTDGANTTVPDAAGTAAGLHTTTDAAIAALNDISVANVATGCTTALTTALTEGYRSAGATASVRDMLYETIAHMGDAGIVGTTKTIRNLAGTTAKTFTLDDGTTPTDIQETT